MWADIRPCRRPKSSPQTHWRPDPVQNFVSVGSDRRLSPPASSEDLEGAACLGVSLGLPHSDCPPNCPRSIRRQEIRCTNPTQECSPRCYPPILMWAKTFGDQLLRCKGACGRLIPLARVPSDHPGFFYLFFSVFAFILFTVQFFCIRNFVILSF